MLRKIVSFFLVFSATLQAEDATQFKAIPLANIDGVSALVAGCVNVITGDYVEWSQDLSVPGPEPLEFERFYASSDHEAHTLQAGWKHNHYGKAQFFLSRSLKDYKRASDFGLELSGSFLEPSGRYAGYKKTIEPNTKLSSYISVPLDLKNYSRGLTNCGSGVISGRTNPKNTKLVFNTKTETFKVQDGMGNATYFTEFKQDHSKFQLVEKIKKTNGHSLKYGYDKKGNLTEIKLVNTQSDANYSWLKLSGIQKAELKENGCFSVEASNGQKVVYKVRETIRKRHTDPESRYYIEEIERTDAPTVRYEYTRRQSERGEQICGRYLPQNRYLHVEYYDKDELKTKDFRIDRVKTLKGPLGHDYSPHTLFRFDYEAKTERAGNKKDAALEGKTIVYNVHNNKTIYEYNADQQLRTIETYTGRSPESYQLYYSERFYWGSPETADQGNLIAKKLKDSSGNALKGQVFKYDAFGNVIQETFYGNITGHSKPLIWQGSSPQQNGCDNYSHYYSYSQDGKNLLLAQWEDNGKGELYGYHSDTDLIAYRFVTDHGSIRIRYFYEYNQDGVLVLTTMDDGSGKEKSDLTNVTECHIEEIQTTNEPLGLPGVIKEYYLDLKTGQKHLIKQVNNTFSKEGWLISQERVDSKGNIRYCQTTTYDNHGNILRSTDALGQVTTCTYTPNDELQSMTKGQQYLQYSYDASGLLYKEEDLDLIDSTVLTTYSEYDSLGNRTAKIDPFGHVTKYDYDDLCRQTCTIYPAIPNDLGILVPTATDKGYDILGNLIKFVDQANSTTNTTYNILGKPILINYPDGTQESFTYNLDGSLAEAKGRNGLITRLKYDFLGREIQKEEYASDGSLLSRVSASYNAFYIISKTAADGEVTHFSYDGAGRLTETKCADRRITFEYDELNRLSNTYEWYENGFRLTTKTYDLLDRVLDEAIIDSSGNVFTKKSQTYDESGNVNLITEYTHSGPKSTIISYNGRKQPIKKIDPSGAITHYKYSYNAKNSYGQTILQMTEIDPLGFQTEITFNSLQKPGLVVRKNPFGEIVSKREIFYSGTGEQHIAIDTVICPNMPSKHIKTIWIHNTMHQLIELIQAAGLPEQQKIYFQYNRFGQKEKVILCDGTTQLSTYNTKGRVQSWSGPDFSYTYLYDAADRILEVSDKINGKKTVLQYENGRLISETLANSLQMNYAYDQLGRQTKITFPDHSTAQLAYDALNLLSITRKANNGETYTYNYFEYERSGQPTLQGRTTKNLTQSTYDDCGRPKTVSSNLITESAIYDLVGNKLSTNRSGSLSFKTQYTYDDTYQLKTETGTINHTYTHDSLYNCLKKDDQNQTFNACNMLLKAGNTTFTYDSRNAIAKDSSKNKEYAHDSLGRLTTITEGNQRWCYEYDAFHRRIAKQVQKLQDNTWIKIHEELYCYQGQNEIGSSNAEGTFNTFRLLGLGKGAEIGAAVAIELQGKVYTPFHDLSGNVVALFDNNGNIVESYQFSAFGEEVTSQEPINPWRFSSKRHDPESGFVYFGRRYYDPQTARWTSPDPLGLEAGPNLYAYVNNSPLTHIDLYGLYTGEGYQRSRDAAAWVAEQAHKERGLDRQPENKSLFRRVREKVGGFISSIAYHTIPTFVGDAIVSIGRCISGERPIWAPRYSEKHSCIMEPQGTENNLKNTRILLIKGMLSDKQDCQQSAFRLSLMCFSEKVYSLYNATHGFISDFLEAVAQKIGLPTRSVNLAVEMINEGARAVGVGGTLVAKASSQGAIILARALEKINEKVRAMIRVYTYGPAEIIDPIKYGLKSADNYISNADPVTALADPIRYVHALITKPLHVTFLQTNSYLEHYFDCDTYQKQQSIIMEKIGSGYR